MPEDAGPKPGLPPMVVNERGMIAQAAAFPCRVEPDGGISVLLVRRYNSDRWGVPKGLVEPGQTLAQAAQAEALEEAGVAGELESEPLGRFTYAKFGGTCEVSVYLLRVTQELPTYAEQRVRLRRWYPLREAILEIDREAFKPMLRKLPERLGPKA